MLWLQSANAQTDPFPTGRARGETKAAFPASESIQKWSVSVTGSYSACCDRSQWVCKWRNVLCVMKYASTKQEGCESGGKSDTVFCLQIRFFQSRAPPQTEFTLFEWSRPNKILKVNMCDSLLPKPKRKPDCCGLDLLICNSFCLEVDSLFA